MTTALMNDPERDGVAAVGSPVDRRVRPHCCTCAHAHVKDYEYPCRGCDEFSRWELADAPPWPQFPRAVEQWHAMKDAMRPNP